MGHLTTVRSISVSLSQDLGSPPLSCPFLVASLNEIGWFRHCYFATTYTDGQECQRSETRTEFHEFHAKPRKLVLPSELSTVLRAEIERETIVKFIKINREENR